MIGPRLSTAHVFNFSNATAAIIDSNTLCMELFTNILRGFGFRTSYRCASLEAGADIAKMYAVDLILIDPRQFGPQIFDFINWLRSEKRNVNNSAAVLMASAHTPLRLISSARSCGADYVIAKPFSVAVLLDRILWVAENETGRRQLQAPADLVSTSGSGVELW